MHLFDASNMAVSFSIGRNSHCLHQRRIIVRIDVVMTRVDYFDTMPLCAMALSLSVDIFDI